MEMNPIIAHPLIGQIRMVGVPVNFEKAACAAQRPAPMLGQHTDEVLRELGYDDDRVAQLREARVIESNSCCAARK